MFRLSSPRTWLVSAAILLGLATGCRHAHKDCAKCEPNPCPPLCEETERGWSLFNRKKDPCCNPPKSACDKSKCTTCGKAKCTSCPKPTCSTPACQTCGKQKCTSCPKTDCTVNCKKLPTKLFGKGECTTCDPCTPAVPQSQPTSPAADAPAALPITKTVPSVVPMSTPISNERFRQPKPAEKPPVELPTALPLPGRPMPTNYHHSTSAAPVPTAPKVTEIDVPRRSFADITAKPQFHHSSDHTQITGQLQYYAKNREWRLRYCSIDEEDRYGGSVTLVDGSHMMSEVKDGMIVRIEGMVIDADSRTPSPKYRVRSLEIVKGK